MTMWWRASGWRRLEIGIGASGLVSGYCVTPAGLEVNTLEEIRAGHHLDVLPELYGLLRASKWERLEIIGTPGSGTFGGWCERADGSGLHISLETIS
jgi:hypothetical protein